MHETRERIKKRVAGSFTRTRRAVSAREKFREDGESVGERPYKDGFVFERFMGACGHLQRDLMFYLLSDMSLSLPEDHKSNASFSLVVSVW